MRLTINNINAEIHKAYPDVNFYKGNGYFYLIADYEIESIYVCQLKYVTMDMIMSNIKEGIENIVKYIPPADGIIKLRGGIMWNQISA